MIWGRVIMIWGHVIIIWERVYHDLRARSSWSEGELSMIWGRVGSVSWSESKCIMIWGRGYDNLRASYHDLRCIMAWNVNLKDQKCDPEEVTYPILDIGYWIYNAERSWKYDIRSTKYLRSYNTKYT